jgi:putative hemolysin
MHNNAGQVRTGTRTFFPLPYALSLLPRPRPVRDLNGLPNSLGRVGSLEIRLATHKKDIRKAQKLRYKVFFQEGGAIADSRSALTRRDICPFDRICDHLIIIDHDFVNRFGRRKSKVVGCYRLLRQDIAERHTGFYSAQEFDIAPLIARHPGKRFLELGRSCVHKDWRSKRTIELMWRGIWTYVRHHRIDVMIGCASLPGTNALALARPLSFLHQQAAATGEWEARALAARRVPMDMLSPEAIDQRRAIAEMPTLLKGYLRVGAKIGDGAVVDRQFGTTDVLVIVPVADIDPRYIAHFGGPGESDSIAA